MEDTVRNSRREAKSDISRKSKSRSLLTSSIWLSTTCIISIRNLSDYKIHKIINEMNHFVAVFERSNFDFGSQTTSKNKKARNEEIERASLHLKIWWLAEDPATPCWSFFSPFSAFLVPLFEFGLLFFVILLFCFPAFNKNWSGKGLVEVVFTIGSFFQVFFALLTLLLNLSSQTHTHIRIIHDEKL